MDEDKPKSSKRAPKVSWRIPAGREKEFDMLVALSGLSMNGFLTDAVFRKNRHNPAQLKQLAQILSETARIKTELQSQSLVSEEIERELKLIRTALMSLMGRRS
ncbi:MAG: hypothetical protein AAFP97_07995 [Pseudomonadota bacterium]